MNTNTQQGTVTFKKPNASLSADKKSPSFTQSVPTIAVSWVVLLVIVGLHIYFTSVISENNNKLNEEILNLTTRNQELETQNQELEKERNDFKEEIQNIQTEWNELNVTRAQWSIDAYCPKENNIRQCKACQKGWLEEQSSCYAINDPPSAGQRNWEGALEDCRGKISDLAVVDNEQEKKYISDNSWGSSGDSGYWIGLRAEDGRWKWVDGRNLTESSWIQQPANNGQCVISVYNEGWKSVSCSDRNRWICEKAALSV
ncbi:natural killer cells antigen CD94-like [Toxotes jaculatrix]|uniref:natural killer cells antigen CD94-like n=1 Tax=Toxotes jaculatrix TaxID=941984 RepID=UPI001B3B0CEC|nr:natural killer cells antigen CD94-like [Toxotes jaculatrix]